MRIAVATIGKGRLRPLPRWRKHEPDLRGAALDAVFLGLLLFRQGRQRATDLDEVAIALLPIIDQLEIGDGLVKGHAGC